LLADLLQRGQTSQSVDPVGSNEELTSSEDELNILSYYDDEQWTGFSGENVQDDGNQRGRGSKPTTIPAGHQVRVMKEATELYQSSSFKLKVSHLITLLSFNPIYS
jgi:U3 small nucleolar RNA-associated protein 22